MSGTGGALVLWPVILFFVYLLFACISVYCLILFIKLAHRGIRALDIYIKEKTHTNADSYNRES